MFSREESKKLRELFWISYGKSFPRKWMRYNTKIKNVELKFHADRKQAFVCLDITHDDAELREMYFERLESLKKILLSDYLPEAIFDDNYYLESSDKYISRVYVKYTAKFSIHNQSTWRDVYLFYNEKMALLEDFFTTYYDYIKI